MSIREKLLSAIGLQLVTNREFIMMEIESLTDEEFLNLIGMCCPLDNHIDELICQACKADHDGVCLYPECETTCPNYKPLEWLNKPNTVNLNIKEVLHERKNL